MTRDLTVRYLGWDSSGRGLYMTQWMLDVHNAIKLHPLIKPFAWKIVVVQGAFMYKNGGGASSSDGFHNLAGCIDIRTWNLTTSEIDKLSWVHSIIAFPGWRRDYTYRHGGMSPHFHAVLGSDGPMSYGSNLSWSSYLGGGDGLAGPGGDYERRPSPKVLYPPESLMQGGWLMADDAAEIKAMIRNLDKDLAQFRKGEWQRDKEAAKKARESKERIIDVIGGLADQLTLIENSADDIVTVKQKIREAREAILQALAADPDVDGKDNPAPQEDQ